MWKGHFVRMGARENGFGKELVGVAPLASHLEIAADELQAEGAREAAPCAVLAPRERGGALLGRIRRLVAIGDAETERAFVRAREWHPIAELCGLEALIVLAIRLQLVAGGIEPAALKACLHPCAGVRAGMQA